MIFLHNIRTVAKYEARMLRRSWFFRLFSLFSLFILTILNIALFSPVGNESWIMVSIPSTVPLFNLYLINIGQSIVVIFLAADFLKRDKKLDTNEVLYTRSMSNFEYVAGKTWGILRLFLGLNIVILSIGMLMNIISKSMSIDLMAYISYLFIISVPTLVFSLGLAFLLMSVIKNQAITFLLLLGLAALNMFYLWFRMGSLFDYMAFGLPIFKSGIVGFDNIGFIINQRLLYFFLGMSFVLATVLLFKRLPQSRPHRILTIIFLFIFLSGAGICGFNTYSDYSNTINFKHQVIETNRKFENKNFGSVTESTIQFIHKGETLDASADIRFLNDNKEPLDQYLFSLNPSLNVLKVTSAGKELKFIRTNQIIQIDPGKALNPGQTDSLRIDYSGRINESFCYPNFTDNIKTSLYRIAVMNIHKRQAFLTGKYVLLIPEICWYPVAALNFYPSDPARIKMDFTNYKLRVKTEKGLSPVSQGRKTTDGEYTIFKSASPLTGLTLAIGNYMSDTLKVDSVEYITYYFPGHDYYKKDLSEIKDTLPQLVSGIMRELETNFSSAYPFKTLSLVEVPVQFYSFPRTSTQTRAEVQPSMVLLPEKLSTIGNTGFNKRFSQQKKRMARNNQVITDKELQVRLFNDFIRNTFISGVYNSYVNGIPSNEPVRYRLGPSFYFFRNNFYSYEYPVINALFESHLQNLPQSREQNGFMAGFGGLTDNDKANLILKKVSFRDLLGRNPSGDTLRVVLAVKGDWLFNFLRSKAGLEKFNKWFSDYINDNKFKKIDIQKFNDDLREKFGFDFYPFLNYWFNGKDQPGFLFGDLTATEILVGDRTRYQVTCTVSNPEEVTGLFNISFRTGGESGGGAMQGRSMEASDISRIVMLEPHESKKIGVVLDAEPRTMVINTIFAKNIPGEITFPVDKIVKSKMNSEEFSGEETLPAQPASSGSSEIIVDNEDPGFTAGRQNTISPLKKLLGIQNKTGENYTQISVWMTPEYWQPVVLTNYYGKYIRSAVYTRSGTGDKSITWSALIKEPGYYDIYTYIGKTTSRMKIKSDNGSGVQDDQGDGQDGNENYKDMHYRIYNDDGVDDITLDYQNADGGWNNLGRYYLSSDTAKVVLTNKSSGRIVIGDAVKWVKQ